MGGSSKKKSRGVSKKKSRGASKKKISNVKVIELKPKFSDEYMKSKEGEYFEQDTYDKILKSDCDVYRIDNEGQKKLLLRFRKNVLPKRLTKIGMENLKKSAMTKHDNRGPSAGVIDLEKLPNYANEISQFTNDKISKFVIRGYKSKNNNKFVNTNFGNISHSNIIGYFDKRDRNLGSGAPPCRMTAFTSKHVDKWDKVIPLIQSIDKKFKKLIPM